MQGNLNKFNLLLQRYNNIFETTIKKEKENNKQLMQSDTGHIG